jgi:hypothetical protein
MLLEHARECPGCTRIRAFIRWSVHCMALSMDDVKWSSRGRRSSHQW